MDTYDNTKEFWDSIFNKDSVKKAEDLDKYLKEALKWLSEDKNKIMDFGCGNGLLLIETLKENPKARGFGIDISEEAVNLAEKNSKENKVEERSNFRCGGVEVLKTIKDNRYEAVILSNVLDSITPMDCYILLDHLKKIIKAEGKILIKVSPYMEKEDLIKAGAVMLNDELFEGKEGLFLRNITSEKWLSMLGDYFELVEKKEIGGNRLFLMSNKIIM